MIVLPLTYLGNIHYFTKLCFSDCVIDIHENFVKQSYRNRCDILTADGVTSLTVNTVKMSNDIKCSVRDTRIDYSKRWQHRHWNSLVSAYRNSPYFDFYADRFALFYSKRYDFLFDLNSELISLILTSLDSDVQLTFSESYISDLSNDITDLRHSLSPKPRLYKHDPHFSCESYYQVFSEKLPFVSNLSIIDLLFCEGPHALNHLRKCIVP